VAQAVQQPQSAANIALKVNDLIVLDELNPPQVNVIGKVAKPGPYDLQEETTVLSIVTEAGGLLEGAALRKAYVLRGSQQLPLDLYGAFVEGRNDTGIEKWQLRPGDVLVVPENEAKFSVMGQVAKPGFYAYPEKKSEATLLKALQMAGGQMANGDLKNATVTRVVDGQSVVTRVDIESRLRGLAPDDVTLEPGDLLHIPVARNQVYVVGKVNKPGPVELQENTTLISLVTDAGGPADGASLRKAYIMRGAEQIPLNLYGFYVDGKIDPQTNAFRFQPGDVLMVPENQTRFAVYGAVGNPGYYPMPENPNDATVLKALSIAGGASAQSADLAKAGIIRRDGTQTKIIPIDITAMLRDGKLQGNVTLQPEDILYVPDRKNSKGWFQKIMEPLGILRVFGLGF
jgi:protein involved in polysaccharide export with SLBB domain